MASLWISEGVVHPIAFTALKHIITSACIKVIINRVTYQVVIA